MQNTSANISFVKDNILQLRLELGRVIDAVQGTDIPTAAGANPEPDWVFDSEQGRWIGRVGGRDSEYFTPTDGFESSTISDIFDRSEINGVLQASADDLSQWTVLVNGQEVAINGLSRKSNILDTAETGFFTFDFKTVEHVFLDLAEPLQVGDSVEVKFNDADFQAVSQTFDPENLISEAVHVNLLGFDPQDDAKIAYLSSWNGWDVDINKPSGGAGIATEYDANMTFSIINDKTDDVVKAGTIELAKALEDTTDFSRNYQGTDVWKIDFSDITEEGSYHVVVDGVGRSQSFEVSDNHWGDIFDVSFSGFYHHRSGIELEEEYTEFVRPRSLHPEDGMVIQQTTIKLSDTGEGYDSSLPGPFDQFAANTTGEVLDDAWGGWHDAGDHDRRAQHHEASRKLIELVELQPEFAESRNANIPENTNDIPDLIDEAIWNLDFFRRLQNEDGGVSGGIESDGPPNYGEGSWAESSNVYAYAADAWSTLEYAASAAKLSKILESYDPDASEIWLDSALLAMEWAEVNLPSGDEYDFTINNSRNLVAAELFNKTGDAKWNELYIETSTYANGSLDNIDYRAHQFEAAFVYARTEQPGIDQSVRDLGVQDMEREVTFVDGFAGTGGAFGSLQNPYAPYGWGNTATQVNYSADLLVRLHALSGDDTYLKIIQNDFQYALGANPLNQAYITGFDVRSPEEILNVDADALGYGPPPGITIYGDYNIFDYGSDFYHDIMREAVSPDYFQVPISESYNGFSIFVPSTEYTVQQGITDSTYVSGYLAGINSDITNDIEPDDGRELMNNIQDGTSGDDNLVGTNDSDIINGFAGNDILNGRFGNDVLDGGADFDLASTAGGVLNYTADLGTGTITANATVVDLQNGPSSMAVFDAAIIDEIYVHIHTVENPGGELRGQVDGIISDDTDSATGVRTVVFNVEMLTGADHVPPVNTDALGLSELSFTINGGAVTYSLNIIMEGLSVSDIMLVNLHESPSGANGPAVEDVLSAPGATLTAETDTDTLLNIEGFIGGLGNDDITGDSQSNFFVGGEGDDIIDGGTNGLEGDTASYEDATSDVSVYLQFLGIDVGGGQGIDTLIDIENLIGGNFNDRLIGDANDNVLTGGDGNDILKGKEGNDTFFGGDGDDTMRGGAGTDIMNGGAGSDILFALAGDDILNGGDDRDFVYGGRDADTLHGDGGDDEVRGNLGNDMIFGDAGIDDLRGGGNNDMLDGGADNDFLFGENGLDILFGGSGNDSLTGGLGSGTFDGLQDTFIYSDTASGGGGFDRIKDWEDGIDLIDLTSFGFTDFTTDVLTLSTSANGGLDTRINFGSGDVLYIEDFALVNFDASDVML